MSGIASEDGHKSPIPGYIFVPEDGGRTPGAYRARWADTWGFFARITPTHCSGHYPVTFESYVRASDAYVYFTEKTNHVGDLSEIEQAAARAFITQIGTDPRHPSVPALIYAACQAMEERMYAHALYEESKNAWENASRDVQSVEEVQAREQAFAAAIEDRCDVTRTTMAANKTALRRTKHPRLRLVCP